MTDRPASNVGGGGATALVLGGGGIAGIAWLTGLLLGLERSGVTLRDADIIVGTSAGSVVGTQLASGAPLEVLFAAQLEQPTGTGTTASIPGGGLDALAAAGAGATSATEMMRGIGRFAVEHSANPAGGRSEVEAALAGREWPAGRDLRVTAVDVDSGERRVFTRGSGVPLSAAVAASCAVPGVWPVVEAGGHRYMDGGMWSTANVDVAADASRVVVIAPLPYAMRPGTAPGEELAALGVPGLVIVPDEESVAAFGPNPLDIAIRRASAEAGLAQSAAEAARLAQLLGE